MFAVVAEVAGWLILCTLVIKIVCDTMGVVSYKQGSLLSATPAGEVLVLEDTSLNAAKQKRQ